MIKTEHTSRLFQKSKRQPHMRQELALCMIRVFDEGEIKPLRLSRMALAIVTVLIEGVSASLKVLLI
jgi:hypothetical protein